MTKPLRLRLAAALTLAVLGAPVTTLAGGHSELTTLEGTVAALGRRQAEGGMEVVTARIELAPGEGGPRLVELAPPSVLEEIGFPVEVGDRLRLRGFVLDDGSVRAERTLNMTRETMTRLRSLQRVPLWGDSGAWLGGPVRHRGGGASAPRRRNPGRGSGPPR